jgi:hypothetical protein
MTINFKKHLSLKFLALVTFLFPLIFAPQKVYSSEYILTCANEDGFLSVFQIKNKSSFQSVTHISSYDPENGEKYSVNLPLQVISKDNNLISTVDVSLTEDDGMIILDVFNLDKKIISSNTIYLDGTNPDLQKYTCE